MTLFNFSFPFFTVNVVTIVILKCRNCGLSKCVTIYLMAMAMADLLVVVFDLILRQIPIVYKEKFDFVKSIAACNLHAIVLFAVTDCSVWFTVTFTFDRFVAICCLRLKNKYCSKKIAALIILTITVLSCLKNIFWYFMLFSQYVLINEPWFCDFSLDVLYSPLFVTLECLHYFLNPLVPFVVILLLNGFTVKHILVSNRARSRLRIQNSGQSPRDPEMESRRKSIILLFLISANFILLWSVLMIYSVWSRLYYFGYRAITLDYFVMEIGFMLQLLSCCTNTAVYVITQTKFREQLKSVLKYPFSPILQLFQQ